MTAIGFVLTTVSMLIGWFVHDPQDQDPPAAYNWALGGACTGLALMAAGIAVWLWKVMP